MLGAVSEAKFKKKKPAMNNDDTDVAVQTPNSISGFYVNDLYQASVVSSYDDSEEVILQNRSGVIQGSLHCFADNKVSGIPTKSYKNQVENCARCVGRVIVTYSSPDLPDKYWCGSGIAVSFKYVLTCKHVLKDSRYDDNLNATYTMKSIHFTFRNKACISPTMFTEKDVFPMQMVSSYVDGIDSFKEKKHYLNCSREDTWKTTNDYVYIKHLDSKLNNQHFAFPMFAMTPKNSDEKETDAFVIGYPGNIPIDKFKEDYSSGSEEQDTNELFQTVVRSCEGFERKIASLGTFDTTAITDQLLSHKCPTLRGCSGGLFMYFCDRNDYVTEREITSYPLKIDLSCEDEDTSSEEESEDLRPFFCGMHVGGRFEMKKNFVVSAQFPEFAIEYAKVISTDRKFVMAYKQTICEYLNYFYGDLEQHVPKIVNKLQLQKLLV